MLSERKREVPEDFNRIAFSYDLLTGLNPGYKKHLVWSAERLGCTPRARILDLCCGTGLSTEALVKVYPYADITALDASHGMLERARRKSELQNVNFLLGDAMYPQTAGIDGPFDAILMAYGIRNMTDPDLCLKRLLPLLRPGGRICFHEYSVADSMWSQTVWNAVTCGIIIPGGFLTSGSARIYRYLRRSVLDFDGVSGFEERLLRAGFTQVRTLSMDGWQRGVVHSFLAERPNE